MRTNPADRRDEQTQLRDLNQRLIELHHRRISPPFFFRPLFFIITLSALALGAWYVIR